MDMAMAILSVLLTAYAGMAGLCVAMDRHARQLRQRPWSLPVRRCWQALGSLFLGLALFFCLRHWGVSVGLVCWPGFLSVAALALVGGWAYRPRLAAGLALLAPALLPGLLWLAG